MIIILCVIIINNLSKKCPPNPTHPIQLNQLQQQQQATDDNENSNTLHPLRGQLLSSRQASSNRDSSLDDSGVVDDHEDNQEPEPEPENQQIQSSNMEVSMLSYQTD